MCSPGWRRGFIDARWVPAVENIPFMGYLVCMSEIRGSNSVPPRYPFPVRLSPWLLLLLLFGCDSVVQTERNLNDQPTFSLTTRTANVGEGENAYIVFTNPSTTRAAPAAPRVLGPSSGRMAVDAVEPGMEIMGILEEPGPRIIDLQMWAAPLPLEEESLSGRRALPALLPEPTPSELESPTNVFKNPLLSKPDKPKNPKTIPATLRKKVTASGVILLIYVADDYWIDKPETGIVNQTMVDTIADKFLKAGENNDIYDWVTRIYGEHWGGKGRFSNVLSAEAAKYITILIDDIYGDGPDTIRDGRGILGYFHTVNSNLSKKWEESSNRRLMFVMDAAFLAARKPGAAPGAPWDPNYSWPQEIFSTLAHEFLHLVSYYQKRITHTLTTQIQVWLEEMIALVTEDLISDKMGLSGPRGVPLKGGRPDYSPGTRPRTSSRLMAYNLSGDPQPGPSLTTNWGKPSFGYSYGISYAFGAYLARNYGGAALFREIVRSEHSDEQAVLAAISKVNPGISKTFGGLLFEWAEASIKSDNPSSAIPTYNFGGSTGRTTKVERGGTSYSYTLGSINLYNYSNRVTTRNGGEVTLYGHIPFNGGVSGVWAFPPNILEPTPPAANVIFQVGRRLPAGRYSWTVELPQGMTAQVVTSLEVSRREG